MLAAICSTCLWAKLIFTKLTLNEHSHNWTKIYVNVEKFYCAQTSNRQHRSKSQTPGILHYTFDHFLQCAICPKSTRLLRVPTSPLSGLLYSLCFYPPSLQCSWDHSPGTVLIQCSPNVPGNFLFGEMLFKVRKALKLSLFLLTIGGQIHNEATWLSSQPG